MQEDWPFDQPPMAAAATCRSILEGAPILAVIHFSDGGAWAFMDGVTWEVEDGRQAPMQEFLRLDPSVAEIADLPRGWRARRSGIGSPWVRSIAPGC